MISSGKIEGDLNPGSYSLPWTLTSFLFSLLVANLDCSCLSFTSSSLLLKPPCCFSSPSWRVAFFFLSRRLEILILGERRT